MQLVESVVRQNKKKPRVVVIGGGFAGLQVVQNLKKDHFQITLIDKRNFHLFQPLLYQVATGSLTAPDITAPLRSIFKKRDDVFVLNDEVIDVRRNENKIITKTKEIEFDYLVVAAGVTHSYFGKPEIEAIAPGLKTVEDALRIRSLVFEAFEKAELTIDPEARKEWTTFCIVGGGPTGVELAGSLSEIAKKTLREEFRSMDTSLVEIHVIEASPQILGGFSEKLALKAEEMLRELGITLHTSTRAENLTKEGLTLTPVASQQVPASPSRSPTSLRCRTIVWAAGIQASPLGKILVGSTENQLDRAGRVYVSPTLTLPEHDHIFVIGDLSNVKDPKNNSLPGIAPVAMSQGRYVAQAIYRMNQNKKLAPYSYFNKGMLAVIGRNKAIAEVGVIKFAGFPAWLIWAFIHIWYLVAFRNRLAVFINWAWEYFTYRKNARLILYESTPPTPLIPK